MFAFRLLLAAQSSKRRAGYRVGHGYMGQRSSRRRDPRGKRDAASSTVLVAGSTATEALVAHLQDLERFYTQNKGLHNDVNVLLAATSEHPLALPQSWRDSERAPATHRCLLEVWKEAFVLHGTKGPPCTLMGRLMFRGLLERYLKSARASSNKLIEDALRYGTEAVHKIVEHSINFDKATAPQDLFTERVQRDLYDSLEATDEWMQDDAGNVAKIKKLVLETCKQGFENHSDLLVDACLQYFQRRTREVLLAEGSHSRRVVVVSPPGATNAHAGSTEFLQVKPRPSRHALGAYSDRKADFFTVSRCSVNGDGAKTSRLSSLVRKWSIGRRAEEKADSEGRSRDSAAEAKRIVNDKDCVDTKVVQPAAAAAAAVADASRDDSKSSVVMKNFSYFLDLAEKNARPVTLSTMLYMVGSGRVHLESAERTRSGALAAEKNMGFDFTTVRSEATGNDVDEVVHIDEFVRWFLPAVNELFTVQTFLNQSLTAFPDVCASLEGYGNPAPAPFPR